MKKMLTKLHLIGAFGCSLVWGLALMNGSEVAHGALLGIISVVLAWVLHDFVLMKKEELLDCFKCVVAPIILVLATMLLFMSLFKGLF